MKLAVVIGKVISDRKEGNLGGHPLLVVEYLNSELKETGITAAAVDTTNAGIGQMVMLTGSSSARKTDRTADVATDNTIIGIVDSISVGKDNIYKKG